MEALLAGMTSLMELSVLGRRTSGFALHRAASAAAVVAALCADAAGQVVQRCKSCESSRARVWHGATEKGP
jgi:hypothetical protein